MEGSNFFNELLVVIVLFRQKPEQSAAYTSLRAILRDFPSIPDIFVYDNSTDPCPVDHSVVYFHDPENSGVSKAYNIASVYAREKKKKWMLLLDQDTSLKSPFLEVLQESVERHPASMAFVPRLTDVKGWVSPFHFSSGRGTRMSAPDKMLPLKNYRFVNSGLLIRHSAFAAAGGYDEDIPLDFSDIAFGERLRNVTDHFVVIDFSLAHQFTDNEKSPLRTALERFHFFRMGAFAMGKKYGGFPTYYSRAFFRASRLCLRHKNVQFLIQFFSTRRS
jgi:GT2 family glycosyltransferase